MDQVRQAVFRSLLRHREERRDADAAGEDSHRPRGIVVEHQHAIWAVQAQARAGGRRSEDVLEGGVAYAGGDHQLQLVGRGGEAEIAARAEAVVFLRLDEREQRTLAPLEFESRRPLQGERHRPLGDRLPPQQARFADRHRRSRRRPEGYCWKCVFVFPEDLSRVRAEAAPFSFHVFSSITSPRKLSSIVTSSGSLRKIWNSFASGKLRKCISTLFLRMRSRTSFGSRGRKAM